MSDSTPAQFSDFDRTVMRSLLQDAAGYRGLTAPNPMVAAALYKGETELGRGVHKVYGGPHAERQLFDEVCEDLDGATLYVTLEPCTHYGKTPPCSDLILKSGIARLVVGSLDPNPAIEDLRQAYQDKGILVDVGCLAEEAVLLNDVYYKTQLFKRPFVTMKTASTLDGRIATASGDSCYISSEESRVQCHRFRREVDAILVGVDTILVDDPQLTVRYGLLEGGYRSAKLVVLDTQLRMPLTAKIFSIFDADSILIVTAADDTAWSAFDGKATRVQVPDVDYQSRWDDILKALFAHNIFHVLIEGGASVFSSAMSAGIVDRYHAFLSPCVMNDGEGMPVMKGPSKETLQALHVPEYREVLECGRDIWVNARYYSVDDWLGRLGHDD